MLEGKVAYKYARQRLGFCTYWRCRISDALTNRFVKRDFVKLSIDGTWCITTPAEACAEIQSADNPKEYKIEPVRMTMRQFQALPELDGY